MWKAIRLHPWRLEIVPAAAFGLAVWSLYAYQTRAAHITAIVPEFRKCDPFRLQIAWSIGMVALLWLMHAGVVHRWVQSERRKRFNWLPLVFQPVIVFRAWGAFFFAQMVLSLRHPSMHLWLLAAMVAGSIGLAFVLEWTRRYVPREETPEPPSVQQRGSCYRETQIDWPFFPIGPMMLAMAIGGCAAIGLRRADALALLGAGVLAAVVFLSLSIRGLTVTAQSAIYRFGLVPLRYPTADIVSCAPAHHETWTRRRNKKLKVLGVTDGRCVEITMKNGRVYRLGAIRPTHVCELIEQARKDLPPTPSAAEGE